MVSACRRDAARLRSEARGTALFALREAGQFAVDVGLPGLHGRLGPVRRRADAGDVLVDDDAFAVAELSVAQARDDAARRSDERVRTRGWLLLRDHPRWVRAVGPARTGTAPAPTPGDGTDVASVPVRAVSRRLEVGGYAVMYGAPSTLIIVRHHVPTPRGHRSTPRPDPRVQPASRTRRPDARPAHPRRHPPAAG